MTARSPHPRRPAPPARRRRRRGDATTGALAALALLGAVATTAALVSPRYLLASGTDGGGPAEALAARVPAHQQVLDLLAALLRRSRAVLAVHPRGPTPYVEIVLWLEDAAAPGRIDPGEVAVIAHSEVLRTIVLHRLDPSSKVTELPGAPAAPGDFDPAFCTAFRRMPDLSRRVLATGVERMELVPLPGTSGAVSLTLTWGADSTDGADEGSIVLHPPNGVKPESSRGRP